MLVKQIRPLARGNPLPGKWACDHHGNGNICPLTLRKWAGVAVVFARRILLELWAMFIMACVVGFLGPFDTYGHDDFPGRAVHWWYLLMGAYAFVRPAILILRRIARAVDLSISAVVFWGVLLSSFPLAFLWRNVGKQEFHELDGYTGLVPFALLCALGVLAVTQWAESAERRLQRSHLDKMARNDPQERATDDVPRPRVSHQHCEPGFQAISPAPSSRCRAKITMYASTARREASWS